MAKMKTKELEKRALRPDQDVGNAKTENNRRPIKVIHAPLNYAGQASMLSQALRAEGIDSRFYHLKVQNGSDAGDVYGYQHDRELEFTWDNQFGDLLRCTQQIIDKKPDIVHLWHRTLIYGEHGAPFNGIDVPLLRGAGARIAFRFTGYELRRKSLEMELNPYSPFHYGFEFGLSEDDQKKFHDFLAPYIDAFVVQDPEMQTYCPDAHLVPRLLDLAQFPVVEREPNSRPLVLHASTDGLLKGTRFVLKAVEELKDEGLDFDFHLIENMPNAKALEQYRRADIIIDQLLIGWYGVLAVETMAMGKAVIAYIRGDLTGYFGGRMPLLNANPDTIRDVLRQAIKDAQLRKEVGRRARAFVEATHDSRVVAPALIDIYEEMLEAPASEFAVWPWPERLPEAWHSGAAILEIVRRVPRTSAKELERKLELLAEAGTLADVERKLAWETNPWRLVRHIPAETPEELERKLELLSKAGTLADVERKLTFDANLASLVRQVPAETAGELRRKLELLSKAGTLADVERRLSWEANPWSLVRRIPAETPEELEGKLDLLAKAGTLAEVERKLTLSANLVRLVHHIPAKTPEELARKLEVLSKAGTLADVERKLTFDANLVSLVRRIPAETTKELERKLELLSKAGTLDEVERKLTFTAYHAELLSLVRQIPAETSEELSNKLKLLAEAGTLAEVERKLGFLSPFEENLLKLLRRIPAKTDQELERKIASLIPKRARAAAIAEERKRPGDYNSYLVGLASRIPVATPAELEEKVASLIPKKQRIAGVAREKRRSRGSVSYLVRSASLALFNSLQEWNQKKLNPGAAVALNASKVQPDGKLSVPTTFTPSAAAFSHFDINLLELLRRIPAKTSGELERKIASLIAEKGRAAAIARAKERSGDLDSYLVNLARHIVATTPPELDRKISSLIPAVTAPPSDGRGAACIVTRKPIRNITRAPRMAKALADAGYRVVVVSPAPPVQDLRDMCPEVEYIVANYRAFTHDIISRLEGRRQERGARLDDRERDYQAALAKGGWRALMRRSRRAITAGPPVRAVVRLSWQMFVVTPSALLLKSDTQSFAEVWRDLVDRDAIGIAIKYVWILTQWASSHAFAARADELTAGRHFDVIQAYDNYGLVAGARLAARTGAKLVYDAVEIATDRVAQDLNILEKIRERLERWEEAGIFLRADKMIGTGDALAGWYAKRYKVPKPLVMRNCRYYWPYREDGRLRADIAAKPGTRVLLWCGSAYPQQGIEVAIRALRHLPPHIHLAVVTDISDMWRKYVTEELPAIAASFGVADRFHILPEREPNDLVPYISDGDLGFVLSVPVNHPNQYYNLPNKFFECVMARLPIGTLAFPEVVSLINKYEMGCVLDEHDSVKNAAIIQQMLEPERYAVLKANVMKAAQILCWENESRPYVELYDSLMPASHRENAVASRSQTRRAVGSMAPTPMPGISMPAMSSALTGTD